MVQLLCYFLLLGELLICFRFWFLVAVFFARKKMKLEDNDAILSCGLFWALTLYGSDKKHV